MKNWRVSFWLGNGAVHAIDNDDVVDAVTRGLVGGSGGGGGGRGLDGAAIREPSLVATRSCRPSPVTSPTMRWNRSVRTMSFGEYRVESGIAVATSARKTPCMGPK